MSRYPEGDALLAVCRAGLGKLVIVEGETDDDDPYFYGRWFGDLARELTFIPQNGHEKVLKAVQDLRTRLSPAREVYGIRDRDFSDDSAWQAQANAIPTDGVLFTRWYTLENYLLVPDGWFKVVTAMHRRPHEHWDTPHAVAAQIADAYRECLPLAAWNHVVRSECQRLPRDGRRHIEHPKALPAQPDRALAQWGQTRDAPRSLDECYAERLEWLSAASPAELPCWVTGKAVLKILLERIPVDSGPRPAAITLVNIYMSHYPAPSDEHVTLVERILGRI